MEWERGTLRRVSPRRSKPGITHALLWLAAWVPLAAHAQVVGAPQIVGTLVGPGATSDPPGVQFYGTDLGWTFEHQGELQILFGDTWPHAYSICEPLPSNDDSQATLPLVLQGSEPPIATVFTRPGAPTEFARILLFRGGDSLSLGYGQVPVAGFSDGTHAAAIFSRYVAIPCERKSPRVDPSCRPPKRRPGGPTIGARAELECAEDLGRCEPDFFGTIFPCDLGTGSGCLFGQSCVASDQGYCIDPTSSQLAMPGDEPFAAAHENEIGIQRPGDRATYDSAVTWRTNKFINATARTVKRFTGIGVGDDYRPGHGALLVWGRPGFSAGGGGEARIYLMVHRLPFRRTTSGAFLFQPLYFAGVSPRSGRPRWSGSESKAAPLALDGVVGGSPAEVLRDVNQVAIAWVGDPIRKWVMLYAGGVFGSPGGAIQIRFADRPWGPWTTPTPHLAPGSPSVVGDLFGPGGELYHFQCVDQGEAACADSDPLRPIDVVLNPTCTPPPVEIDVGFLYAPNVIDAYTRPDGAGGVDVYWNVSVWNPYAVLLVRTNIRP
jgi:hypothetical protein